MARAGDLNRREEVDREAGLVSLVLQLPGKLRSSRFRTLANRNLDSAFS